MRNFDFVLGLPGGFDANIHATLELFGLAQHWQHPPYYTERHLL